MRIQTLLPGRRSQNDGYILMDALVAILLVALGFTVLFSTYRMTLRALELQREELRITLEKNNEEILEALFTSE